MAKKRRKRRSRFRSINFLEVKSKVEQRKKFPKKLIKTFIDLDRTSVLVKKYGIEFYEWTKKAYKLYITEAEKYLGKKKLEDKIESGKLVVLLAKATMDIRDEQNKAKKEKQIKKSKRLACDSRLVQKFRGANEK